MMRWCGNCCGAPEGEGEAHPGGPGDAVHHVIYNRVGRVEKFKHKGLVSTVFHLFLKPFNPPISETLAIPST